MMYVANWFSDFFAIWVATIIFWLWKPILSGQKAQIDMLTTKAFGLYSMAVEMLDKYIPKYKEPALKKD